MAFELPELPYAENALEPYISKNTIEFHYGKHHRAYVDNLNKLIAGTEFEHKTLEQIVEETAGKSEYNAVFNNAAQAWNHAFFWNCMMPAGGGEPVGELKEKIVCDFGSYDKFCEDFLNAAVSQFGSGWAWLPPMAAGTADKITPAFWGSGSKVSSWSPQRKHWRSLPRTVQPPPSTPAVRLTFPPCPPV